MSKLYFHFVILLFLIHSGSLHAETPTTQPSVNPALELENLAKSHHVPWPFSIVGFFYKNENGKWVTNETTYKKLPPELQNKDWNCWIDYNGLENCKALY